MSGGWCWPARPPSIRVLGFAVAGAMVALAGCGGSGRSDVATASSTGASVPPLTVTTLPPVTRRVAPPASSAPETTVPGQLPTVPNCGGGAYKPATLLIVCASGDAATMATGVSWRSWGTTTASGTGTVHLLAKGRPATGLATLTLADVATGSVGPQFRRLTVAWMGTSPTGTPEVVYHLQPGGG
jgi:hypothetical protein